MPSQRDQEILPLKEIKYVFNIEVLQPGDILLMNTYHESQRKLMALATGKCIYDHAALYLGDAFLMEANGFGVVMNHIFSYGFKEVNDACVMRLKKYSPVVIENVIYNAKSFMGMEFDSLEARIVPKVKDTNKEDTSNRSFCSRLVSQCYSKEGIKLFANPDYCSPDDFLGSDQLQQIDSPLMEFTSEMEATVKKAQTQRSDFDSATYWAIPFQQFSQLYGEDIQTMGQLIAAASKHIDKDDEALAIIANNGLFEPVKDRNKYQPWLDNDEDFFNHFNSTEEQLFFLCNQLLHHDLTYIPSYKQNFASCCIAEYLCPQSRVIERIQKGATDILDDAIYVRKRLAYLYAAVSKHDEKGFKDFVEKYGFYKDYVYKYTPISIDHILRDMMKASSADSNS